MTTQSNEEARPFRWDFQVDEGGLPTHLPMGVTVDGHPENDARAHHFLCWCADPTCFLTVALRLAWESGRREGVRATVRAANEATACVPRVKPYLRDGGPS